MSKEGYVFVAGMLAIFVFAFVAGFSIGDLTFPSPNQESSLLKYDSRVCVYKNDLLVGCDHNVLYNNGRNMTRDMLGNGATGVIQNISLCNASAACGTPVADATESFTAYSNCGLGSQQGTYNTIHVSPGNWSVTKTFTSTCDNVNTTATRLTNVTGGIFAGNSFTLVTLQTNDQLTINWSLMIS